MKKVILILSFLISSLFSPFSFAGCKGLKGIEKDYCKATQKALSTSKSCPLPSPFSSSGAIKLCKNFKKKECNNENECLALKSFRQNACKRVGSPSIEASILCLTLQYASHTDKCNDLNLKDSSLNKYSPVLIKGICHGASALKEKGKDFSFSFHSDYLRKELVALYEILSGEKLGNRTGDNPLRAATFFRHYEVMKFFIEKEADVNFMDPFSGETPLKVALEERYVELYPLLLVRGVDLDAKDKQGKLIISEKEKNFLKVLSIQKD